MQLLNLLFIIPYVCASSVLVNIMRKSCPFVCRTRLPTIRNVMFGGANGSNRSTSGIPILSHDFNLYPPRIIDEGYYPLFWCIIKGGNAGIYGLVKEEDLATKTEDEILEMMIQAAIDPSNENIFTEIFVKALTIPDRRVVEFIRKFHWFNINLMSPPIPKEELLRLSIVNDFPNVAEDLIPLYHDVVNSNVEIDGKNLLWLARENQQLTIARLLIDYGAQTDTPPCDLNN